MTKLKSWNKFDVFRTLIIISIIIYILGIVPQFTEGVKALFSNTFIKIVFLALIILAGYFDSTIGILLSVAFILSYLSTPENHFSPVYNVMSDIKHGTHDVVGGVSEGTQQLVGSFGDTASNLVGGVSSGAQNVISGIQRGTQHLTSGLEQGAGHLLEGANKVTSGIEGGLHQFVHGIGGGTKELISGTQDLVQGVGEGVNQVVGGIGSGVQELVGSANTGSQKIISGVSESAQDIIDGLQRGAQHLTNNSENMTNGPAESVSQIYQQHSEEQHNDSGCNVNPVMTTGCDPIVGYNASYDNGVDNNNECLYKGVQVWDDELNAQGLNNPRGYSGGQVGSSY